MNLLALVMITTIPFTYHDNRMLIQCMIEGQGPFTMVLDTGAPNVTITPEIAARLELKTKAVGAASGAGNNSVEVRQAELHQVSLGSAELRDVQADVVDLTQIRTKFHFARLDGIIGYPLFKRYITFVNVDAGKITLSDQPPAIPAMATTTPFAFDTSFSSTTPVISAEIDGIPAHVVVDTGDRSSLTLFGPFAHRHGFYGKYPSKKNIVTGYGLGGPIYADVFTLPKFRALGETVTAVVTRASRQIGGAFTSAGQDGSIGTGILKRFNIVYDYANRTMTSWPSKNFTRADVFVSPT